MMTRNVLLTAILGLAALSGPARADMVGYYVGRDSQATIPTGIYAGQANPNYGRPTLLLAHGNHFHRLAAATLTGPADAPSAVFSNTRSPEGSNPPIPLGAGSGAFAGKLISGLSPESHPSHDYDDLRFRSVLELAGYADGSPESILYGSTGGRYDLAAPAGSSLALELVGITAGLNIADAAGNSLLGGVGSRLLLGAGSSLAFSPVFWIDATAPEGTYSASLKLVDLDAQGRVLSESGVVRFDFQGGAAVPEPAGLALLGLGVAGFLPRLLRRRPRAMASV